MNTVLELENVSKIYGHGHTAVKAVDNVSLQVKPGEIVLIMGPSGSGKTTLLSIAGLLLRPTDGHLWMNGNEVTRFSEHQLPSLRLHNVGFVFQAYNLLGALTALENVEVVMNMADVKGKAARTRAIELLTLLGLEHRLNHLPADLSGGEKQRVALARALANNPPLILADEPTGNLDSKIGREVMELLCCGLGRDQGRAIVIVTHDHRLRDIADRVLWLEDGKLSEKEVNWNGDELLHRAYPSSTG
ncbi:MAG: ABC transporter ATP-binding protein [Anaerolineae bacterium]